MRTLLLVIAIMSLAAVQCRADGQLRDAAGIVMDQLEGITHYGMPIEEIRKKYHKDDAALEIVYSKTLSDDNMDDYVQRFYDELLQEIQNWLYTNRLPARDVRIVISNCKFCKVGYCKSKGTREVTLTSYMNSKKKKQVSFSHDKLIEKKPHEALARSAVQVLLEK